MSFIVPANFIDVFKIGDNINFNLSIQAILYDVFSSRPDGSKLIKPIVIINTSIAEAILFDFIENRIRRANRTEVLFADILSTLRGKRLDKFAHYIEQAKKYDFFNAKDTNFYGAMDSLRQKRNRVHIQNNKNLQPADENEVFDERVKVLSEKVLEKILNTMSEKYPRRAEYHNYVRDFVLPWNRHFPAPTPNEALTIEEAQDLGII